MITYQELIDKPSEKLKYSVEKFKPRQQQLDAISFIKENKDKKFYLLDLPPGVGKSHIAMMIIDWVKDNYKNNYFDIITAGKLLQDQYNTSYPYLQDMRGIENYYCETYDTSCLEGQEICKLTKNTCSLCPAKLAKERYEYAETGLTNFHIFLHSRLNEKKGENFSSDKRASTKILVIDEAHELDTIMSDFIAIKINENIIKKYDFDDSDVLISKLKAVKTKQELKNFYVDDLLTSVVQRITDLSNIINTETVNKTVMKQKIDLENLSSKIGFFEAQYDMNDNNWVLEINKNEKNNYNDYILEPIWCTDYMSLLWKKYDKVFFMSGTILDKDMFSRMNGLDVERTCYHSIDSPFPLENRKTYFMNLGKMTYNEKEETFMKQKRYIKRLLNKYKDKKGLIHTNSFELSNWIENSVDDERLLFHKSDTRESALKKHFESTDASVIVSPSLTTGVSFDDDYARFQIICKIPYPSLASNKNKVRKETDKDWYSWKTIATLIQASGRCVRSMCDYADTIIIDGSFSDILKYNKKYLPRWYTDSISVVEIK